MYRYDVIIVGGGPAGLSCAIELQKKGISNCVIEKAKYPRDKLCGGLVTEKAYKALFDLCDGNISSFQEAFIDETNNVSIWDKDQQKCSVEIKNTLRFVDRRIFDSALKEYYISIGGTFFDCNPILNIDCKNTTLYTKLNNYQYQILIAADGARSFVRKKSGLILNNLGFCLETYIPKSELSNCHGVQIHFNIINDGYSWVFPSGEYYKIGFGNIYNKSIDYISEFQHYLSLLGITKPLQAKIHGAFIPYGGYLHTAVKDNSIIFVGDAAGMVDPIYGEGLFFALCSGKRLISSIEYNEQLHFSANSFITARQQDLKYIKSGNRARALIFKPFFQKRLLKLISQHKNAVSYYVDNQVSLYKYIHNKTWKIIFDYYKEKRG